MLGLDFSNPMVTAGAVVLVMLAVILFLPFVRSLVALATFLFYLAVSLVLAPLVAIEKLWNAYQIRKKYPDPEERRKFYEQQKARAEAARLLGELARRVGNPRA